MADGGETIAKVVTGLKQIRREVKPGDITKVLSAFQSMESLPLPESYLRGVRDEIFQMLSAPPLEQTSVYLAFFGVDARASYLKIGVAKNVRARMGGIATGNPLTRLWTFAATYACRDDATKVESALLAHMAGDKIHGEWIRVAGLSKEAAQSVVDSLAEVAEEEYGAPAQWIGGAY